MANIPCCWSWAYMYGGICNFFNFQTQHWHLHPGKLGHWSLPRVGSCCRKEMRECR